MVPSSLLGRPAATVSPPAAAPRRPAPGGRPAAPPPGPRPGPLRRRPAVLPRVVATPPPRPGRPPVRRASPPTRSSAARTWTPWPKGSALLVRDNTRVEGDRLHYFVRADRRGRGHRQGAHQPWQRRDDRAPRAGSRWASRSACSSRPTMRSAPGRPAPPGQVLLPGQFTPRAQQPLTGHGSAEKLYLEGENQFRFTNATWTSCKPDRPDWYQGQRARLDYDTNVGEGDGGTWCSRACPGLPAVGRLSARRPAPPGVLSPTFGTSNKVGFDLTVPPLLQPRAQLRRHAHLPLRMGRRGLQLRNEARYITPDYKGRQLHRVHAQDQVEAAAATPATCATTTTLAVAGRATSTFPGPRPALLHRPQLAAAPHLPGPSAPRGPAQLPRWRRLVDGQRPAAVLPDPPGPEDQREGRPSPTSACPSSPSPPTGPNCPAARPSCCPASSSTSTTRPRPTPASVSPPTRSWRCRCRRRPSTSRPRSASMPPATRSTGAGDTGDESLTRTLPIFSVIRWRDLRARHQRSAAPTTSRPSSRGCITFTCRTATSPSSPTSTRATTTSTSRRSSPKTVYTGGDRISNANQVTTALQTRLIDPASGAEKVRAAIGQRYYMVDQRVSLNQAPRCAPANRPTCWPPSAPPSRPRPPSTRAWQYNPRDNWTERFNFGVRFQPAYAKALGVSWRYRRNYSTVPIRPTVSRSRHHRPVAAGGNWYGVGRYNRNLRDHRLTQGIAGIEYNGGCWVFRGVVQHLTTSATDSTRAPVLPARVQRRRQHRVQPAQRAPAQRARLRQDQRRLHALRR